MPATSSRPDDVEKLADAAYEKFGEVAFLMNNAGIGANPGKPWENREDWKALIEVNFWGAVYGVEAFAPRMIAGGAPGLIVNTGSKQGITTPPGNLAYNVSKAALKTFTEGLAHELRNIAGARLSAHLLIPGFTYTGLTTGAAAKPAGAWTGEQVADFMLERLAHGDFYILCPDNETERADRRAPHGMGGRRHHREPPGFVALAPGLQGRVREVPHGMTVNCGRWVGRRASAFGNRPLGFLAGILPCSAASCSFAACSHLLRNSSTSVSVRCSMPMKVIMRLADPDQLVELRLHCRAVAVLRVLDQEHHQEGDDGGAGVDDQLPGIGEAEDRAGRRPDHHDRATDDERRGSPAACATWLAIRVNCFSNSMASPAGT